MALFDGVQNFTPAFTGRQLAIQSGQGAGASIARGTSAKQRGESQKLDEEQFKFQKDRWNQEFSLQKQGMDDLTKSIERYFGLGGSSFLTGFGEDNYGD